MLGKYERGEIPPEDWRRFRLVRGTYGQRQDDVQMLRIKIPQGIVTGSQMRALAGRRRALLARLLPRHDAAEHPVSTSCRSRSSRRAMRELADEGLTTREACGNSVRNITGCPYAGTSAGRDLRRHAVRRGADALFPAPSAGGVLPRKFKIAFEGCAEDHALGVDQRPRLARARSQDGRRGFRVTVAGGTSILPVSGYVLYEFLPVEEMFEVAEAVVRVFHRYRRLRASAAQSAEVHRQGARLGRVPRPLRRGARGVHARGRRTAARSIRTTPCAPKTRRTGRPPRRRRAAGRRRRRRCTPVTGPGIMPGTVRLQPLPDTYVRWMRTQRQPAAAGRLLPRHRAAAAR